MGVLCRTIQAAVRLTLLFWTAGSDNFPPKGNSVILLYQCRERIPPAVAAYPVFLVVVVVVYPASPLVISFQCFELRWLRGQKAAAAAKRDKQ